MQKEHLKPLNLTITEYFTHVQIRKVPKDSMVRFRNHQYSASLNCIEKEVEVKPSDDNKSIKILFQRHEVRSHNVTCD